MIDLTPSDRKVLAALTRDARAPVTKLAQELGLSRATIQASIDRLVTERVIQRFTVEIDPSAGAEAIRAVTTIKVEGNLTSAVVRTLNRMPEVVLLHSTNGAWDLVAQIEATSLADFDRVLRICREIPGILSSETSILLSPAS
ncbi:MAG: Lrp/AsnC family transcriptional regulator [Pseudomonadota bacterium]